jgi:glycerophosphoryl diester phosphodiesterase
MSMSDVNFALLDRTPLNPDDHALALRHAPRIRFDRDEPFLPSAVGYTVFRGTGESPSFPRQIQLPDQAVWAIEYAVWWDWDIQHLYELEHIWVYLDVQEQIIAADASWHGGQNVMVDADGRVPLDDGRVMLFSEPGKHAFAPVRDWLLEREPITRRGCGDHAGKGGVLVTDLFRGHIHDRNPLNNQLAWTYLERQRFEPTYDFSNVFDLATVALVPWPNLFAWIPPRITWWTQHLREIIPPHERRVIRIAHRGAAAHAQENSLAAVQMAADLGSDMVEVDVRLTADGVPVISHDATLKRVWGIDGVVGDYSLEELRGLTPAGQQPIMTLAELAQTCRSLHLGIYLDIKELNAEAAQTMIDVLRQTRMLGATIWGSFRPDWVAEIRALEAEAQTSILFSSQHIEPVALARAAQCTYVHPCWERFDRPHELLTPAWLDSVRQAGLGIVCWHEERPAEIAALQRLGVNAICSDNPERLLPGQDHVVPVGG